MFRNLRMTTFSARNEAAWELATEAKAINVEYIDSTVIEGLMDRREVA